MPVNDLGYRNWNGRINSPYLRWLVIAFAGIKIVFRNQWIKRAMFLAWGPALAVAGLFFFYEQYVENRDQVQSATTQVDGFQQVRGILMLFASRTQANVVVEAFMREPDEARGYVWSFILLQMLRKTQGWMVLVMIGLIAPPLISQDVRSRAFLFYFSKPISRLDYLLGKFCVVGFFVGFVTILPTLSLYVLGVLLSPSLSVIASTWYLPFQVVAACLIYIIPTCLIGLALSSITSESRFAGFAWFMVWILGYVGYHIVMSLQRLDFGRNVEIESIDSYWRLVSLYDSLGYLQGWIMGLETNHQYALPLLLFVIGICVFCVTLILRRVSAPLKA